jgi:hypothetical protein
LALIDRSIEKKELHLSSNDGGLVDLLLLVHNIHMHNISYSWVYRSQSLVAPSEKKGQSMVLCTERNTHTATPHRRHKTTTIQNFKTFAFHFFQKRTSEAVCPPIHSVESVRRTRVIRPSKDSKAFESSKVVFIIVVVRTEQQQQR